ncbi:N-acetylmuramoyl-L-alanine amidase, partial [bacterium]|nr:N-acetylmuramoyl-L-alanine amidase [bacterium]
MKHIKTILIIFLLLGMLSYQPVQLYSRSCRPLPDLSAFTIVLDPGHGGKATGAVGPGGLTEKQVNLEVALVLRDLLEERNCKVIMTRIDDHNVKMSGRTALVKKHRADLFLSLHHNATLAKKWKNHTQTYYAMKQDQSSRLLGRDIHEAMCGMFNFPESKLLSGNYYVLRNCGVTSVLGEPCFLTDPVWEDYLHLRSVICNEAIAYYRGIIRYLSRGVITHRADWLQSSTFFGRTSLTGEVYQKVPLYSVKQDKPNIIPISIGKFTVSIDGIKRKIRTTSRTYKIGSDLIKSGKRTIEIRSKSDGGNVLDPILKQLIISPKPANVIMNPEKVLCSETAGFSISRFYATDGHNRSLCDGIQVEFTSEGCSLLRPSAIFENGSCLNVIIWEDSSSDRKITTTIGLFEKMHTISALKSKYTSICGFLKDSIQGKVVDVRGMDSLVWIQIHGSNSDIRTCGGYFEINQSTPGQGTMIAEIRLPGYFPKTFKLTPGQVNEIELRPRHDGILINRRIILDPLPENYETQSNRKKMMAMLNYNVTFSLAEKLRKAGADVRLTRKMWAIPTLKERIACYNSGGVNLGLAIDVMSKYSGAKQSNPLTLFHYHTSSNGKRFCKSF